MSRAPKKSRRQRRFHQVDLETIDVDQHEVPDWVAGANKK